jgi:prolyl oligopeptidase
VVRDTLHGTVIEDPYRWLEDKDSPETRDWIGRQMEYTRSVLGTYPGRRHIESRLAQLLQVEEVGAPVERGGRCFFTRRTAEQQQRVLVMRPGIEGRDTVLVDPNPLSPDHTTSAVYSGYSPDGALVAVGTRQGGRDEVAVTFLDLVARRPLADVLPVGRYLGVAPRADHKGVYYSRSLPEGSRVYYHAFGTDGAKDTLLFGEGYGPQQLISVALDDAGRWLMITVTFGSAARRSEIWVKDVVNDGPVTPIVRDIDAAFAGEIAGDRIYLRTDWKAPLGRIVRAEIADPSPDHWREIVPESTSPLQEMTLAGGRVIASYLEEAQYHIRIFGPEGRQVGSFAFLKQPGTIGGLHGRWSANDAFFTYSSFAVPTTIHRLDTALGVAFAWWTSPAPVRPEGFVTEAVWFTSKDGTRVPMFLFHRKDVTADGRRPVLLTGYGGFKQSMTPGFSTNAVLWAESGGVYALACLRGGNEFGEPWHRAGMLEQKQHTFDDFIAAAEWMVANRWTAPAKLSILGGSNGGLLVGAFITQRPDLCGAAICSVPLLDMLRYQRFLVARFWVPEYGSSEDAAQFEWLRAYSPYQHVVKGTAYPAVMLVSGDSDTRVDPLHARKMTALLQASTSSDPERRPVLLRYDTQSGHSRAKPVSRQIEDDADVLQFLFQQLGMDDAGASPVDAPTGGPDR